MSRYLPPVYSPLSFRDICSAAAAIEVRQQAGSVGQAVAALVAEYPGYGVQLTNSGTSALALALRLAFERVGSAESARLVAAPAYACPDVGAAAVSANARLSLYDTDPETLEPDWSGVERSLRAGALVVLVTYLFGRVFDMTVGLALARRYGALLVEDAAQHAGGRCAGVRGGGQSTLGVLSFGRGKGLNSGGGGALLHRLSDSWEVPTLPKASLGLGQLTQAAVAEVLSSPSLYGAPARVPALAIGKTEYREPRAIASMPTSAARLLVGSLGREPRELSIRRANEQAYYMRFSRYKSQLAQLLKHQEGSGALRTPVLISKPVADRQATLSALGVVRSYPRALTAYMELTSYIENTTDTFSGAAQLSAQLYTLPTHSWVMPSDIERICSLLKD